MAVFTSKYTGAEVEKILDSVRSERFLWLHNIVVRCTTTYNYQSRSVSVRFMVRSNNSTPITEANEDFWWIVSTCVPDFSPVTIDNMTVYIPVRIELPETVTDSSYSKNLTIMQNQLPGRSTAQHGIYAIGTHYASGGRALQLYSAIEVADGVFTKTQIGTDLVINSITDTVS